MLGRVDSTRRAVQSYFDRPFRYSAERFRGDTASCKHRLARDVERAICKAVNMFRAVPLDECKLTTHEFSTGSRDDLGAVGQVKEEGSIREVRECVTMRLSPCRMAADTFEGSFVGTRLEDTQCAGCGSVNSVQVVSCK